MITCPILTKATFGPWGVVYELATFEKPFMADSIMALAMQIVNARPRDIGSRYSGMLQQIINLMLEKDQNKKTNC